MAVIAMLIIVELVIVALVISGGRDHGLTVWRMQTVEAFYAAEA